MRFSVEGEVSKRKLREEKRSWDEQAQWKRGSRHELLQCDPGQETAFSVILGTIQPLLSPLLGQLTGSKGGVLWIKHMHVELAC
jgi:hypothetical protein